MDYRREIDGLRALAILPVIFFHAGCPIFSGGFIGVDVFFVISGYLITSIILTELDNGKFSLVAFYERRARRILPALFLVMLACLPFAWQWLLPADLKEFSRGLIAVSTFVSNILFWSQSGYFDTATELKPLLHTWSLAVEEQFYLLFPLLLLLIWRKIGRRWALPLLASLAVISLITAQLNATAHPAATFFLLPTRVWELLMGSGAAFYLSRPGRCEVSRGAQEVLGLVGAGLIVFSIFAYSEATPFPSFYALVPTTGALLVVLFTGPSTLVGRLLGMRLCVGIGLVSYSAYLWHQPLFAFARQRSLDKPASWLMLGLTLAVFVLAWLSWRFVEKPFRQKGRFSRREVFTFSALGLALFIGLGVIGEIKGGFAERQILPAQILSSFERTARKDECFDKPQVHTRSDWYCYIGKKGEALEFAVLGDSHALSLLDLFDEVGQELGRSGVFAGASGCPPLLGVYALRDDQAEQNCHELNLRAFKLIKERRIRQVFLVGRWTYYTDGAYSGPWLSFLGRSPQDPRDQQISRDAFAYGLNETIERYHELGVSVVVVAQAPMQRYEPQQIYLQSYREGGGYELFLRRLSVEEEAHRHLQAYVNAHLMAQDGHIRVMGMDDVLCEDGRCLVGSTEGSFYMDDNHLSRYGAWRLYDKARALLTP